MRGAKNGKPRGQCGAINGHMPASSQLRFAFRELQALHAVTILSHVVLPPAERGTT